LGKLKAVCSYISGIDKLSLIGLAGVQHDDITYLMEMLVFCASLIYDADLAIAHNHHRQHSMQCTHSLKYVDFLPVSVTNCTFVSSHSIRDCAAPTPGTTVTPVH
jgi:hypothetical protein